MDDRPEEHDVPDWKRIAEEYDGYSIEPGEKTPGDRRREQEDFAAELSASVYESREIGIAACRLLTAHYKQTDQFWIYRVSGDAFDPVAVGIDRDYVNERMPEGKEEIPYVHELYDEEEWEGTPQQFVAEQLWMSAEGLEEYAPMFSWSSNELYHEQPELMPILERGYTPVEAFDGHIIAPFMEDYWKE